MERLPDEVLVLILRMLPALQLLRVAKVCRRWAALVAREALLMRSGAQAAAVGTGLRVLLVTAPRVSLQQPLLAARNLRQLTVHAGAPLSERDFAALQSLPFLAHLDVFALGGRLLPDYLPVLRRISTLVLNDFPEPGLLAPLVNDNALQELHMYGYVSVYFPPYLTTLLGVRRLHLRELTLRCAELCADAYVAIGTCDNLSQLRLYSCCRLEGEGAVHLARPRRLRVLHVTGALILKPHEMTPLLLALPSGVRELVLSDTCFGDEHAALLPEQLPQLQLLELWRCRLSPAGAERLALALPALCDFDCDLRLSPEQVRSLCAHPALQHLRAALPPAECTPPRSPSSSTPVIRSSVTRRNRHGAECEGFRAKLFYYWTRDLRLPPPPPAPVCFAPELFDSDDEDYVGEITEVAFFAPVDGDW